MLESRRTGQVHHRLRRESTLKNVCDFFVIDFISFGAQLNAGRECIQRPHLQVQRFGGRGTTVRLLLN